MKYLLTSIVAGLALFACDDHIFSNGKGHTSTSETEGNAESLLINACSSCHGGGLAPNLAADICDNLVNVPSTQAPSMNFVTPNEPENSYLWHKLNGTGGSAGGTDTIMPTTGALAAADLAIIEEWINNGAVCGAPIEEGEVDVANGEAIVTNSCLNTCHGTGPSFDDVVPNVTNGQIVDAIQNGVGAMPPQGAVTDYEIVDVVAYLRATYGEYVPVEDTGGGDTGGEDTGSELTAQEAAAGVFVASCGAYCHPGQSAPDFSDLCANVVDVDSTQLSSMKYVTAGDLDNSYLWHKLNGTAGTAGGVDTTMPPGGLSTDDLQIIEDWITSGVNCQ